MRIGKLWPAAMAAAALPPIALPVTTGHRSAAPARVSPTLRIALAGDHSAADAMHDAVRARLVTQHVRLATRYSKLSGDHTSPLRELRRAHHMTTPALRASNRRVRSKARELDVPIPAVLQQIAECESHGNPRSIGGGGAFRGKYQFSYGTWASVGGHGDPAQAPEAEQDRRAAMLLARSGSSPWPVCGA